MEQTMYYGAKPNIFDKAKELRSNETYAEKLLWEKLERKQLKGLKFRRQHPIDIFIADFYCHDKKMVIEVDGGIHELPENNEYDIGRTNELENHGIKVIRFTNDEVINSINEVLNIIIEQIELLS